MSNLTKVAILYYGQGDPKSPMWESCCELIGPESLLNSLLVRCEHGGEVKERHLVLYAKGPHEDANKILEEFDRCPACGAFPMLWPKSGDCRMCKKCGLSVEFPA